MEGDHRSSRLYVLAGTPAGPAAGALLRLRATGVERAPENGRGLGEAEAARVATGRLRTAIDGPERSVGPTPTEDA